MKYNININQKALAGSGIDLKNAAILDYLIYYCNSKNEYIEQNRVDGYTWINYKTLLNDMPLLDIKNANALTPRIHKLAELGFIETKEIRHNGYKRLLVKMTRLIDDLIVENTSLLVKTKKPNRETKVNNNTIYNNTIYNNTTDEDFEKFYSKYPLKKSKQKAKEVLTRVLKEVDLDTILKGLDNYLKEIEIKGTEKQYIKHPTTWLNQRCWDDDYITETADSDNEKYRERFESYYNAYKDYILIGLDIELPPAAAAWDYIKDKVEFSDDLFDKLQVAVKNYKKSLVEKYGTDIRDKWVDGKHIKVKQLDIYTDELQYIIKPVSFITNGKYNEYL